MNHDIILDHAGSVSQVDGRVACPDSGLRILARLIARDLVARKHSKGNKKPRGKLVLKNSGGVVDEGLS